MISKILMGLVCIAAAILLRIALFQSDSHLGIQRVYLDIVFWLPSAALLVSLLVFLILVPLKRLKLMQQAIMSLGTIIAWALVGVAIAVLIVMTFTFIENSPQGPLAIIIDAPLGATVGILVGLVTYVIPSLRRIEANRDVGAG
jgi:hypothetical protein